MSAGDQEQNHRHAKHRAAPRRCTTTVEPIESHCHGGWLLFVRSGNGHPTLIDALATMNLALVLLATTGGFGMIFSLLVHPQIRSYNRASVFIAFLALTSFEKNSFWKHGWLGLPLGIHSGQDFDLPPTKEYPDALPHSTYRP